MSNRLPVLPVHIAVSQKQASMTDSSNAITRSEESSLVGSSPGDTSVWMSRLGTLLEELEQVSSVGGTAAAVISPQTDNQLIQVRLGIASSLYIALRLKHAATASHGLRVALSGSAWASRMNLPDEERDIIEVAALLHDVGMIGVPDEVLLKPGPLDSHESLIVERARAMTLEVLRAACAEQAILGIVENTSAWYDGSKGNYRVKGADIPLGSRMIAIVEAFDAMTTDRVFRPALSIERAAQELFEFAGSQFDPELVEQFVELQAGHQSQLRGEVAGRWLRSLVPDTANPYWELNTLPPPSSPPDAESMFPAKLLESMHDAVLFVDVRLHITLWNHGAERLTGISGTSVHQNQWTASLLKMQNEKGELINEDDCPVLCAISSGVQSLRRLTIFGRTGKPVSVDSHVMPVVSKDGTVLGAILLMHDASSETSLEERCQSLHEKATKDLMTQVANRAEFDRVHEAFVKHHKQQQVPCSLIICDLDRFKLVNDNYGHQAGDEAIKTLAKLLRTSCRTGDLVARYGGEEFVMLCADCDNATAARRADQIRKGLSQISQPKLDGRSITASFGVTEIQPGDNAETMLRRADRALLMAKSEGRNRVVQLGVGAGGEEKKPKRGFWASKPSNPEILLEQDLLTRVPIVIAIEKLRGFVADRCAKIVATDGSHVRLEIDDRSKRRRRNDRPITFSVELTFSKELQAPQSDDSASRQVSRTRIQVTITPHKKRDRRRNDVEDRAREVLANLRSYLMASVDEAQESKGVLRRAKRILTPFWPAKG